MKTIEIFSAGCPICTQSVELVQDMAGSEWDVRVLDLENPEVAERASSLGVRSIPAILIDGKLAACCTGVGASEDALRAEGVGT